MDRSSTTEKPLKAPLFVEINAELKELLGRAADEQNIAMNALIARVLAKYIKRPDLAIIPKNRIGRPRKPIAV